MQATSSNIQQVLTSTLERRALLEDTFLDHDPSLERLLSFKHIFYNKDA
jgi:hypothetical protein